MTTDQLYRERAREARDMAASTSDDEQRLWREIAAAFEQLAELSGKDGFWLVERVEKGK